MHPLILPNEIALLLPVKEAQKEAFDSSLEFFHSRWQKHWGTATHKVMKSAIDMDFAQKIADLVPRQDKPGEMGFPVDQLSQIEFEKLFFVVMKNGVQHSPILVELQIYEPFQKEDRKWKPGEVIKPHHIPAKPTDMPRLDLFTKLAHAFGVREALLLQERLCPAEIDRFLCHYNEVSRPFEERKDDVKERAWQGFIESDEGKAIMAEKVGVVTFERDDDD